MQEKIFSTLATEALKPASSFIDAFLGPKLERIRNSARNQELRERLQDPRINGLLEDYFKRLLARVSEIKTLVFPEQVIPLTSVYEPLHLSIQTGKNFRIMDAEENIKLGAKNLKPGRNYLIIDSAGMGKSTFAKYLVLDIFESTYKIPLFLELRRIEDNESLLGKISKELDASQNDIDEEFLMLLLGQGEYIIILDGYDELSEYSRKRISPQITDLALNCARDSILLTSRPEVGLPEIPRSNVYNIQPLERKQAESLVLRYDNFAKIDVGKRLITQFDRVSEEFLTTPLLLILLYRTFGYNQSIATNITSFYDDVYNAFYKGHDLTKAGFSRAKLSGLDQDNFRRLLRAFSFLILTAGIYSLRNETEVNEIIEKAVNLTLIKPTSISNFFEDLLVSVPFLVSDGGEFRFIHKSICEFFAAEYLASAPDAEKKIKIILKSNLSRIFNQPLNFLHQLNPSLFRRSILAPAAKDYIETGKLNADPLIRTLYFCGVAQCGASKSLRNLRMSRKLEYISYDLPSGQDSGLYFSITFKPGLPSSTWSFLGVENNSINPFASEMKDSHQEFYRQLLSIKWNTSITSDAFTKYARNKTFRAIVTDIISHLQNSIDNKYWLLDDKICKSLLRTIREERKAQSQIDALIKQSFTK